MSKPLLESEGWVVTGPIRCKCPRCGAEISSNAFARNTHKKKCEGWRRTETPPPAEKKVSAGAVAAEPPPAMGRKREEAIDSGVRSPSTSSNPTPPPAPRLPWIEDRFGSWREWNVTYRDDRGKSVIYLRIREMAECTGGNRYATYAGNKYVGAYSTLEIAQGSVERLVGVK